MALSVGVGNDNEGILVLGATNIPWTLDSAIRRRWVTVLISKLHKILPLLLLLCHIHTDVMEKMEKNARSQRLY